MRSANCSTVVALKYAGMKLLFSTRPSSRSWAWAVLLFSALPCPAKCNKSNPPGPLSAARTGLGCGSMGVAFLSQGMRIVSAVGKEGGGTRRNVVRFWTLLYAFVGSQMAWTLRPFIGAPSMKFELFRQLGGNFYSNVLVSLGELLGLFVVR